MKGLAGRALGRSVYCRRRQRHAYSSYRRRFFRVVKKMKKKNKHRRRGLCFCVAALSTGLGAEPLRGRRPIATRELSSALGAPVQRARQGLMTAVHLHTCLQLSPVLIQVMIVLLTPQPFLKLLLTAEGEDGINCLRSPVTDAAPRTV